MGGGGPTALTAKLDCSHCRSTSLQPKFNYQFVGGGGVQLHSLQSWTAVTADQLHCSPSSTTNLWGGGGGPTALTAKLDCSHCRSTSLQPKFNWGGLTALTAKLDCSHCRSTSLQPKFNWGGSDCTHCKVGLQSLQINFTAAQVQLGGGSDCTHCKVGLQSLQINFTAAQVQLPICGGGGSNCTHCKVGLQSLQINFTAAQVQLGGVQLHSLQSWTAVTADQPHCSPSSTGGGGSDCTHCKVGLQSLQINFTAAQVQPPILRGGGVTLHVHFVQHHEISVPPSHSVRSTGWPLVNIKII